MALAATPPKVISPAMAFSSGPLTAVQAALLLAVAACVAFLVVGAAVGAAGDRRVPEDRGVGAGSGARLGVTAGVVGVEVGDPVEVLASTAVGVPGIPAARSHAEAVSSVAATATQSQSRRTVTVASHLTIFAEP
ncbi:hypothetical protein [Micromonospora sp. MH33]|uniref:hypothetical protein n=1 Tax=Micromonospora sp. MH33 TaxID=1945509 RepID=UPI001FEF8168|nr:hypothetical protein [Micromonospora sp. MH33]